MKKYIIFLVIFISSQFALADIIINEVMYNPEQCDDYDCEWIEIYNNNNISVNLTSWMLDSKSLDGIIIDAYEYIVLADELIDSDDADNESFEVYWGNSDGVWNSSDGDFDAYDLSLSLKNTEDTVNLTNGTYIDTLIYSSDWGADGNNHTLEKINPNLTNSQENWEVSLVENGTPGYQNSIYGTGDVDYSVISISEFLPNPAGDDNAPMPDGEWIELYNPTNSAIDIKWLFFKDLAGHYLYIIDTTVKDESTIIPANGYLVVYANGQSGLLNNEGIETLAFYDKSANLIKNVSYADPVEGNSYAYVEGIGWQHTKPTPNENNTNYSDVKDSYLGIENIYDLGSNDKAEFGQSIRIKLQVYKGDSTKDSIALWIEDDKNNKLSKQSKTNVYTKYTSYTLTLPIQIKPNCDESFEDNNYTIHAEGLDVSDTAEIYIEGITADLCEKIEVEKEETKRKFEFELVESPDTIKAGEDFSVKVRLANNDDEIHKVDIWSYVFRGNKCYSCIEERDENKKMVTLPKKDSVEVKLKNKVDKAEPGDYKLKVALVKDDQKTVHDITASIALVEDLTLSEEYCKENVLSAAEETEGTEEVTEAPLQILNKDIVLESVKEPRTVYASANIKIKELIPAFIIITLAMFCSVLVWKR